jgi:succinate dehydrogenase hydrophobic anchor subunit
MKKWAMRILGALNVLFGFYGLWFFVTCLNGHFKKAQVVYNTRDWIVFCSLSFCTVLMVSSLAYLGVRLIIGSKTSLRLMASIFAAEILYFFADAVNVVPLNPSLATHVPISYWAVAASPIAPQIITGYPLLGIVLCVVLLRRRKPVEISS